MKLKGAIWIVLLTLSALPGSYAWQNPQRNIPEGPPAGMPTQVGPQVGVQGVSPNVNRPPLGYQPPVVQPPAVQPQETANTQDGWPTYPYPQYHNPYYEGAAARNLLTEAVDWIVAVPSNVVGKVCDFLDTRVFPNVPATHGGSQKGGSRESSADNAPMSQPSQGVDATRKSR